MIREWLDENAGCAYIAVDFDDEYGPDVAILQISDGRDKYIAAAVSIKTIDKIIDVLTKARKIMHANAQNAPQPQKGH